MNSFLEKLFSIPNFGTILLLLIIVLSLVFVILFALALKDSKKNKQNKELLMEQDTEANMSEVTFAQNNIESNNLEVAFAQNNIEPVNLEVDSVLSTNNKDDILNVANSNEEKVLPLEIEREEQIKIPQVDDNLITKSDSIESEIDLKNIAMSLAKEYQNELNETKNDEFVVKPLVIDKNEVSMSNANEDMKLFDIDNLPTPQPVKVVGETKIIDSSEKKEDININNIKQEEYSLK